MASQRQRHIAGLLFRRSPRFNITEPNAAQNAVCCKYMALLALKLKRH